MENQHDIAILYADVVIENWVEEGFSVWFDAPTKWKTYDKFVRHFLTFLCNAISGRLCTVWTENYVFICQAREPKNVDFVMVFVRQAVGTRLN